VIEGLPARFLLPGGPRCRGGASRTYGGSSGELNRRRRILAGARVSMCLQRRARERWEVGSLGFPRRQTLLYRLRRAAVRILASMTRRSSTASCFQDREVEDDSVGPAHQTYRNGKLARALMGWLSGLRGWVMRGE
jgi:hypothetical protein